MGEFIRCTPGQPLANPICQRHAAHYYCKACDGYYGVPHDYGCHMTKAVKSRDGYAMVTRDCACRYCEEWQRGGLHAATQAALKAKARMAKARQGLGGAGE